MTTPTARDFELIEVALESAAVTCDSGAALRAAGRRRRQLDPLAVEYLHALAAVQELRRQAGL